MVQQKQKSTVQQQIYSHNKMGLQSSPLFIDTKAVCYLITR